MEYWLLVGWLATSDGGRTLLTLGHPIFKRAHGLVSRSARTSLELLPHRASFPLVLESILITGVASSCICS